MRRSAVVLAVALLAAPLMAPTAVTAAAVAPPCDTAGSATTTVYLPNVTKTLGGPTGWVTPFIVQNVGFFATTLEVSFYRFSDGALVACRKVSQLQPGRSFADVPNNDTYLPDGSQFAVVVRSFGAEIVAVVNEHNGTGARSEALAYDGLSSGSGRVALPYVAKNADGWLSTVIVQNVGVAFASVSAAFTSLDGTLKTTLARTVAPGRSAVIDPRSEPDLIEGTEYSAIVTSSSPIGVVVNSHADAADVAHPRAFAYNGVEPTNAPGYLPLVARNTDGIGRTSRLIVQNTSSSSASPTLDVVRFGGGRTIMAGPSIGPGRAWSFDVRKRVDGTACPAGGGGCVGEGEYGVAISGGQFATLDIITSEATSMAFSAQPSARSRMFLPNVTRTLGGASGWTTPIIVQPPVGGPTSVSLRWYRFADGRFVTQQVVPVVPGAGNRIDPRTVSGLTDNTQYAVIVDATGPFSAIVQEAAQTGGATAMIYPGFASEIFPTPVPAVIAVTPPTSTVAIGASLQLAATVTDQFGAPVNAGAWPLTWTVSPASLGTISPSGLFVAAGYGSGKVVASAGATSTAVTITVQSPAGSPTVSVPTGYSTLSVPTSRGTFTAFVVKQPLSAVTVRTVTGNAIDCVADCPAQPLVEYLNQTASFAGMNGTYFCPPDYAACASEVNAYSYAVYSSVLGAWLNEWALVSPTNSLVTVSGGTLRFYEHTYEYDRSAVDAAISNFPLLLRGGAVVDSEAVQTDYQRQRGYKGSIGTDGTSVFLVLVAGASVTDSAYVVQALGETDAMNLDGGGSSALFGDGAYRVGPGRQLPNAVVLTPR